MALRLSLAGKSGRTPGAVAAVRLQKHPAGRVRLPDAAGEIRKASAAIALAAEAFQQTIVATRADDSSMRA